MEGDLYDFSDLKPPNVTVQRQVFHPDDRTNVIGHTGFGKNRQETVATFPRHPDEHLYRKYDGYAVSERVLEEIKDRDCKTIFIIERSPDGYVMEFDFATFWNGKPVAYSRERNDTIEGDDAFMAVEEMEEYNDLQRVAKGSMARVTWSQEQATIVTS
jgi:hypothetical protein